MSVRQRVLLNSASSRLEAAAKERDVEDIADAQNPKEAKEMLTREQRSILLKQGYAVVGSHR